MRGYVGLFRMPGYPWIGQELTDLLDTSVRVIETTEVDPLDLAGDLAEVLETAARLLRDVGAEALIAQQAEIPRAS